MRIRQITDGVRQKWNEFLRYVLLDLLKSKAFVDFHLHEYSSYEEYRRVQIYHNVRKIGRVWADATTLDRMAERLTALFGAGGINGVCHGSRNGFEQNYLNDNFPKFTVIGTDISPTAKDFPNSTVWDFHMENPEWVGKFDFVYSNSLDQSWKPREALETWLGQVKQGGVVIVEHSDEQSPLMAGEMDPFGVRPAAFPFVIADWFGHEVSISFCECRKENIGKKSWLFFIMKNAGQAPRHTSARGSTVARAPVLAEAAS